MVDIPLSSGAKITVERREQMVLIGINRPQMFNRIDPEAFYIEGRKTEAEKRPPIFHGR